ncbi:MAG: glycerol-3-phosphate dehydrogenase [Pseudomonadota bacterium]|nr:glycerol-3-phosphate dehydrogenase [Pseudomonadota bacterium]
MADTSDIQEFDLFIIGGGVNGCGIARDAAGRGLRVGLAEMNDLGSATSSASTKLFHGGLRYLEYLEFRLVRESLIERETLLRAMPHISWPMRFVLPYKPDMRFEGSTPVSRIVSTIMPWMKGRRPAWLIRLGLFLYDHLGGRELLPGTKTLDLRTDVAGTALKPEFVRGYEYSDCWIEDSRLVVLNARDAMHHGASIMPRTQVVGARRETGGWTVTLRDDKSEWRVRARMLVNAAGPWAEAVIRGVVGQNSGDHVRLVRGSHLVMKRLFDHDRSYFLQGTDGRIIFAIPYEGDFTLIGTTDKDHPDAATPPVCTEEESDYLLDFASQYFRTELTRDDIVWRFSGVRPLYDDGAGSASAATRDYVLRTDDADNAPLLNIFGGKITTYRKLAEAAMAEIAPRLGNRHGPWTAGAPLPGGDFAVAEVETLIADLCRQYPFLDTAWARRLVRAYGTDALEILGEAERADQLGEDFGATITAAELDWVVAHEWVATGDDFLWRRSKLGLRLTDDEAAAIDRYVRGGGKPVSASMNSHMHGS